jgi:hypothetical protein
VLAPLHTNTALFAKQADDAGGQEPQLPVDGVRMLIAPSDAAVARQILAGTRLLGLAGVGVFLASEVRCCRFSLSAARPALDDGI